MPSFNVPDYFNQAEYMTDRHLREGRANKVAIYFKDQQITYAELVSRVNQTGNALKNLGVEIENRVMIALPDCPELFYSYLGAMKIGSVPIPVSTLASPKDYAYYLNDSRAKIIITTESLYPKLAEVKKDLPYLRHIILTDSKNESVLHFEEIIANVSDILTAEKTAKDDMAYWMYTSGTTGVPKAVVHLHHDLLHCMSPVSEEVIGVTPDDIVYVTSKIFFTYGRNHSLELPLIYGASAVLFSDWSVPAKVFPIIDRYRPSLFFSVPTFYNMMLKEAEGTRIDYDLSSVRMCISAGEALPKDIYFRWKDKFGLDIINSVGSTDVGGLYLSCRKEEIKPGSAGKLLAGYEGILRNEQGEKVPSGEVGSLWLKNDGIASMYWHKHEKTKEVFQGQWFNTGDLFFQDADGYFWYQSRADDMLKISGQWVSPIEIEDVLMKHPSVCECGVVGNPDESGLLKAKAFIVLNKGFRASSELEKELINLVHDEIAHFKAPRKIEFVNELPRTATGKLQRHKLRQS